MRRVTARLVAVASGMSLASFAHAAVAPFHLTTADLVRRDVQLKSITATDVVVFDLASKREQTLTLASVVAMSRSSPGVSTNGTYMLRMRDGQRILCTPTGIRNDSVICATRELGERTIPIADIASIGTARSADAAMPPVKQDELRLANGDQLRGIVTAGDAKTVTCQTPDGQAVAVAWSDVRTIRFADTQASKALPSSFIVTLASGTRVRATSVLADNANVTLTLSSGNVRLLLADVASIDHIDGDAMMLAWTLPTSEEFIPYFPAAATSTATFVVDSNISDGYGATTAIRVRPKTTLRWATDASFRRLRVRCVVPSGRAFADVTVRVMDGDRVAFERKNLKSGSPPIDIDLPLSVGRSLSLEADYGEDFDVQDEVVWLDAALLKSSAPPAK